jgi:hypothetical protein
LARAIPQGGGSGPNLAGMNQAAKPTPGVADDVAAQGPWIEIFVAGTHTDASGRQMTFTEAHLDEVVASYDPKVHEAPVVVGHPKTDDPALGWISALKRDGIKLLAQERQVAPEFEEARDRGAYKKRSASFYLANSPGNPTPGKMHIRHVGWLGGMPPAIKGMADKLKRGEVAFSDDGEGVIEFNDMVVDFDESASQQRWAMRMIADAFSGLRDKMIEQFGAEGADRIIPRYTIDQIREAGLAPRDANSIGFAEGDEDDITDSNDQPSPEEQAAMTKEREELDAAKAQLEKDRQQLASDQAALASKQSAAEEAAAAEKAAADAAEATEFAEELVQQGKLLPKFKAAIAALFQAAQKIPGPLNFGEGEEAGEAPATQIVRDAFEALPKAFDFSEKSGDGTSDALDFSDPAAIATAATNFQKAEKAAGREIDMASAVQHITKGAK